MNTAVAEIDNTLPATPSNPLTAGFSRLIGARKVMLGLATVVVFSLGFAATLVAVGIIAAKVGQKILEWLSSIWVVRVQIATTLLILGMGIVLTVKAAYQVAALAG